MLDFFLVIGYNNRSIQQYWIVYIILRRKICAVSRCCLGFFRLTADKLRQYRLMRRKNNKIYMERYRSGYNGLDSKSSVPEMVPWVRIPPAPLIAQKALNLPRQVERFLHFRHFSEGGQIPFHSHEDSVCRNFKSAKHWVTRLCGHKERCFGRKQALS